MSYIQGVIHSNGAGASATVVGTLPAPAGNNNTGLMVSVGWASVGGDTVTGITDDKGNTYQLLDLSRDVANSFSYQSAELVGVANAPQTITATLSTARSFASILIDEFSQVGLLDQHAINDQAAPGSGVNAVTSGNVTTTTGGQLIYGSTVDVGAGGIAPGTGFTQDLLAAAFLTEHQVQTNGGTIAATFTDTSGAQANITFIMTFKLPPPAPAGVPGLASCEW